MTASDISPPVAVLTGAVNGIGLIPTATPLTRLNYFDGRFLRADDLQRDQRYVRALVAASNQALGSGVAHGFDVDLLDDDSLRLGPGLAITPSGAVVLLPGTKDLPIGELIARSRGEVAPASDQPAAAVGFEDCELLPENERPEILPIADAWVVSVSTAEAACGDEDVYGRLCEDACVTDSEKSYLVDGVAVRVQPLALSTFPPSSQTVPDAPDNLRSRLASAFFASERDRVADLRSAAGLASPVWCRSAPPEIGDGVPIAVLVRSGNATVFVDPWIPRREIMEPPPARYWAWRTGRRPWAVFLAQVLQFQCQLIEAVVGDGSSPGTDPCADERATIGEAAGLLNELHDHYGAILERAAAGAGDDRPGLSLVRVAEVRAALSAASRGGSTIAQRRRLISHGLLSLPPAGFLPVSAGATTVEDQVRAWTGEGVDLRFCVARPDVIAHAFDEAQHLDRISLTQGLDDPSAMPEVDVLVPDGVVEVEEVRPAGTGLRGSIKVLPRRTEAGEAESTLQIDGAGRVESLPAGGVQIAVAGLGQAPEALSVGRLAFFAGTAAGLKKRDDRAAPSEEQQYEDLAWTSDAKLAALKEDAELARRLRRVGSDARTYLAGVRAATRAIDIARERPRLEPFRPNAGEKRPVAWFSSVRFDDDPGSVTAPDDLPLSVDLVIAAPAIQVPALIRSTVSGGFRVDSVQPVGDATVATGRLVGPASWLVISDGGGQADSGGQVSLPMALRTAETGGDRKVDVIIALEGARSAIAQLGRQLLLRAEWRRGPVQVKGGLYLGGPGAVLGDADVKSMLASAYAAPAKGAQPLFTFDLDEEAAVLQPGNADRDRALEAVDVAAAMLADRDPGFTERASGALFPPVDPTARDARIRTTTDWVMFHHRRERVCLEDRPAAPPATARYRVLHVRIDDLDRADELRDALLSGDRDAIGALPLDEVAEVGFQAGSAALDTPPAALLADWQRVQPGNTLRYALVAPTAGDAELAQLRLRRIQQAIGSVSATLPETLSESSPTVPSGLDPRDADGVIVLLSRDEVQTTCHTIWRLTPEATVKALDVVGGFDPHALTTTGLAQQFGVVDFDVDSAQIVDGADELTRDWGDPAEAVRPLVVVWTTPGNTEAGSQAMLSQRGRAIADALGYDGIEVEVRQAKTVPAGCPAATMVIERPVGACHDVYLVPQPAPDKLQALIAGGRIAEATQVDGVQSLGTITFQAGSVVVADQSDLTVVDLSGTLVRSLTVGLAVRPGDDPEPNFRTAQAQRAALVATNTSMPVQMLPLAEVETFPDTCPYVLFVVPTVGRFIGSVAGGAVVDPR